jgi:protein subunit release factor B
MVKHKHTEGLLEEMKRLNIDEDQLVEKFVLGSGSGGQKINKTANCVYLKHIPTRIIVKCQKTRSRELNRYYARKELIEKVKEKEKKELSEREKKRHKIRKQKQKRSKRAKEKMLKEKKIHSVRKKQRQKPESDH